MGWDGGVRDGGICLIRSIYRGQMQATSGSGWRSLHTIVPRVDDCMLLIPLSIPSSMMLMIWEGDVSDTKADVTLQEDTALLIAGKCKLWVGPRDQGSVGSEPSALSLQCIVFCLSGVY